MIDIQIARAHLKADGDDDNLIALYIPNAVSICEGFCNRKFYATAQAQIEDFDLALDELTTVREQRNTAVENTCDPNTMIALNDRYLVQRSRIMQRINGLVVDGTITAAILMVLGSLYKNRQEVVVGQYSGASQIPLGARRILEPYLWIGELGGMGS